MGEAEKKREWYLAHRQVSLDRAKQWKKDNPDRVRRSKRKARGVKNPSGEVKVGVCESCCKRKRLFLDHDHVTGEPRSNSR